MKPLLLIASFFTISLVMAQDLALMQIPSTSPSSCYVTKSSQKHRLKSASYTALGYNIPLDKKDIVIGGTTTVYKKFGFFMSYKVGIQNLMMPNKGEKGEYFYDNVKQNGWTITGNAEESVTFSACAGLTIAVARKVPIYFGAGATRFRQFFEYLDPNNANKPYWNINPHETRIEPNFCGGIFVPLFGRVILNAGYEHNPRVVFVGLGIRAADTFEDADEWWWGGGN